VSSLRAQFYECLNKIQSCIKETQTDLEYSDQDIFERRKEMIKKE